MSFKVLKKWWICELKRKYFYFDFCSFEKLDIWEMDLEDKTS